MAKVELLRNVAIRGGAGYRAGEVIEVDDAMAREWATAGWAVPVSATAAVPAGDAGGSGEGRKALDRPPADKMLHHGSGVVKAGRRNPS